MLHLHLVETRFDQFDRILDRADVDLGSRQLLEAGIQRRGLAGTGRAGDQDDAVRPLDHRVPDLRLGFLETERGEVLDQHLGIENPQHEFLAEGGRHARQAQLDLGAVGRARLDAAVLRLALLGDIEPAHDFDPADHRGSDIGRDLVDLVHGAIDPETHVALLAARLDVDVAGALVEGVLQQPVDDADDVLVLGVDRAGLAEFDELLEVLQIGRHLARRLQPGAVHRLADAVKLDQVILQLAGIGEHRLDRLVDDALELEHPFEIEGIGDRDDDLVLGDLDGEDLETRRVGVGHDRRALGDVHLQRIEVITRMAGLLGEPVGQPIERQSLVGPRLVVPLAAGDDFDGMQVASILIGDQRGDHAGLVLLDHILRDQQLEDSLEVTNGFRHGEIHGGYLKHISRKSAACTARAAASVLPVRPLFDELFDHVAGDRADLARDDLARRRHQEGRRQSGDQAEFGLLRRSRGEYRIGDEIVLEESFEALPADQLDVDADDDRILVRVAVVKFLQLGHFVDARRTPGRPVIDDDPFAEEGFEVGLAPVDAGQRHVHGAGPEAREQQTQ